MSVINKMLQDLDRRQAAAPGVPFGTVAAVPASHHSHRLGLLTAGLFVTGIVAIGAWVLRNTERDIEPSKPVSMQSVQVRQAAPIHSEEHAQQTSVQQTDNQQIGIQQTAHTLQLSLAGTITTSPTLVDQARFDKADVREPKLPAAVDSAQPTVSVQPAAAVALSVPDIAEISDPDADEPLPPPLSALKAIKSTAALISVVHKRISQDPAALAERAYQTALVHIERGEKADAERELSHAHALQPEQAGATVALATLYLQQAQMDKAEALLVPALTADPDNADLRLLLARTRLAAGKPNDAWQLLREHAPTLQSNTDYHAVLAALEQQLGHSADAAVRYNALLAIDSTQGVWWLGLGLALESQQRRGEASDAYRHALMQSTLPAVAHDYAVARVAALGVR